jgi:hypothetical protein
MQVFFALQKWNMTNAEYLLKGVIEVNRELFGPEDRRILSNLVSSGSSPGRLSPVLIRHISINESHLRGIPEASGKEPRQTCCMDKE